MHRFKVGDSVATVYKFKDEEIHCSGNVVLKIVCKRQNVFHHYLVDYGDGHKRYENDRNLIFIL